MSLGNSSITAIVASRWSQSLGALVTSAASKSGPAASAKECGSGQAGGRGRGNGTFWMASIAVPTPSSAGFSELVDSFCSGFDFVLCCCDTRELSPDRRSFRCCPFQFSDPNHCSKYLSDCECTRLERKRSPEDWG